MPEKKFATIVNLVTPCLRFTRSSSTFCSIPPNLEMIQAISFRGHCPPPPRSQIIVHLVRLSIDRRHMSSAAAVGPWCGARSCLLCPSRSAYCCSAAVLKATTRSAKSSAPTSACVTASVRVYREGGRPTTTSPQCVPHMQNTHCGLLHAPCKQRQPIRPNPQHVELLRTKAEADRLQLSERLTRTGNN